MVIGNKTKRLGQAFRDQAKEEHEDFIYEDEHESEVFSDETFIDVINHDKLQLKIKPSSKKFASQSVSEKTKPPPNYNLSNNEYFQETKKNWDQEMYYLIKDYQNTLT